jgi:hypothetical protein
MCWIGGCGSRTSHHLQLRYCDHRFFGFGFYTARIVHSLIIVAQYLPLLALAFTPTLLPKFLYFPITAGSRNESQHIKAIEKK